MRMTDKTKKRPSKNHSKPAGNDWESNTVTVTSMGDFTNFLTGGHLGDFVLFRGQSHDKPLLPKIARIDTRDLLLDAEARIFSDFREQSVLFFPKLPTSPWDWLATAQHYGLPTRLLDWTRNPLAALWFVVAKTPKASQTGVVWVFTPGDEDFVKPEDTDPFSVRRTRVFRPAHSSERIRVQSGYFTIHTHTDSGFIALEKNKLYKQQLQKLIIPGSSFADLRYDLDQFGINEATLFPGLEGLCRNIEWLHSYLADEKDDEPRSSIKLRDLIK